LKIPVVNLDDRNQTIVKGTNLGITEEKKEIRDAEETDSSSRSQEQDINQMNTLKKSEVIGQLMRNIPKDLTNA